MVTHAFPQPRHGLARTLAALALAIVLAIAGSVPAHAIENLRKYAGIVLDAKTGQVLYQEHAEDARYPASITKVMTLYILFQELAAHHISLNSLFTVSPYAASASPTKLGLRAGSKIKVEDVIKSIVTISANDMARVIAENIAGSEPAFARRMTATAHALGMDHTTYYNASGLPDGRQRTTVHDQAILASAVYEHFPQYYHFFQTRSFQYGRRVYGNHDYVLGYLGVDGLKTGYINAAGYNLMTATRQGNRHLVVVAFGFNTGGARDAKVRYLVQKYLPKAHEGSYYASAVIPRPGRSGGPVTMVATAAPKVTPMPAPDFRNDPSADATVVADAPVPADAPAVAEAVAYAPEPLAYPTKVASLNQGGDDQTPVPMGTPLDIGVKPAVAALSAIGEPSRSRQTSARPDVIGQSLSNMLLGAPPAPLGSTRPSAPLVPPVGIGEHNEPIDLINSGSIAHEQVADTAIARNAPVPVPAAAPGPSWIVQIGAAPTKDGADRLLATAAGKVAQLNDLRSYVERFDKSGQTFYRARFIGFGDRDGAASVCEALKKARMSCLAMQS